MKKIKSVDRYNAYGVLVMLEDGTMVDGYLAEGGIQILKGDTVQVQTGERSPLGRVVATLEPQLEEWYGVRDNPVHWLAV
jgi:hypothetical protein